jgi:hypothetical protein
MLLVSIAGNAQTAKPAAPQPAAMSMDELSKQVSNPLSRIWSLAFQNDFDAVTNDLIKAQDGHINVSTFQPILPMPLGEKYTFFARPVIPLITIPRLNSGLPLTFDDHTAGLGDIVLAAGAGSTKPKGLSYGGGVSFIFPTASRTFLGNGKYQAGPAIVLLYTTKRWEVGTLAQQWWSIAGDHNRLAQNHLNAQYFIIRSFPHSWQIRTSPNVTVDWRAKNGKLTFPVGIGVGKLVMLGRLPAQTYAEYQFNAVKPDIVSAQSGFRAGINFIIPNPFAPITATKKH